ncbi:hypothetical protein FRX31_028665 [Thalictrum thalictroides]|uniref:Uncharacterized protein n=1 Tax=Thalictrum thalictroides TaxID=46969 RepID=A0A7J6V9J3_THATH|nr:hypothetical protein FRX31_028665 [Thalictrum thalictroides]
MPNLKPKQQQSTIRAAAAKVKKPKRPPVSGGKRPPQINSSARTLTVLEARLFTSEEKNDLEFDLSREENLKTQNQS